jgi:peptide/nickel transport system substrate-binding protein
MPDRRLSPLWAPLAPLLAFAVIAVVMLVVALTLLGRDDDAPDGSDEIAFSTSAAPEGERRTGGTISVSHPAAPRTLNRASRAGNTRVVRQVMAPVTGENLLTMTADYAYVPQLAEEVPSASRGTLEEDPLTVRFTIREDAAWSDGVPVTGEDVRFTWQAMIDPENTVAGSAGWQAIERIDVEPERTVTVVFRRPYPEWRSLFSSSGKGGVLLPAHALEGRDLDTAWRQAPPLGTGPYVVDTYRPGTAVLLRRNPNYWNDEADGPFVDAIIHRFGADGDAAERDFVAGRADLVSLRDFSRYGALSGVEGATVLTGPSATVEHLHFNTTAPLVSDPRIRRALALMIDRDALAASLSAAPRVAQSLLVPEQGDAYAPVFDDLPPDLVEAERLLAAAGFRRRVSGELERRGAQLTVEIVAAEDNPSRRTYLRDLAEQLDDLGIRVRVRYPADLAGTLSRGRFQIAALAYENAPEPQIADVFATRAIPTAANGFTGRNISRVSDARLDRLRRELATELRHAERVSLLQEVQQLVAELTLVVPLYQWPNVVGVGPRLGGVALNPTPVTSFADAASWYVVEPEGGGEPGADAP